jgi:hypothetical protein
MSKQVPLTDTTNLSTLSGEPRGARLGAISEGLTIDEDPRVSVPRTLSPHATCTYSWMRPVGIQKLAVLPDLRFQAAASYWLMSLPRTDRRRILP